MWTRPFSDIEDPPESGDAAAATEEGGDGSVVEDEYRFDGFTVEVSEKVMLTPMTVPAARPESRLPHG